MPAEPLKEYITFSKDTKDTKSLNQEVAKGVFGLFQCLSEAKARQERGKSLSETSWSTRYPKDGYQ